MTVLPDLAALAREAASEDLPALLGRLAEAEGILRQRLMATVPPDTSTAPAPDENLGAEEAARRLGVSVDWLYRLKVPFKVRIGRRVLFSAKGLERWNKQRTGIDI